MADCPTCGENLDEDASDCGSCGTPVAGSTASFGPVPSQEGDETHRIESIEGPALVVRKGPELGERFFLDRPMLTVGRDPESDIFLNDMTVSRAHASLEVVGDQVTVRDLGSLNGTYVNGVCIDAALLQNGDIVQIGTFQMVFVGIAGSGR